MLPATPEDILSVFAKYIEAIDNKKSNNVN